MCPRGSRIIALLALIVSTGAVRAQGNGVEESLEGWLEQRGLYGLVAAQLERRIDGAEGRRKRELAQRLAGVYARLLEETEQGNRRQELISRGQRLLDRVQEADTVELRLSLARAAYGGVESAVERLRLRLDGAEDPAALRAHLVGLEEQFREIGVLADQRVRALEKQEELGSGNADDDLLSRTLGEARRHRSLSHYYGGWSCVYLAELHLEERSDYGAAALRHFGWLLNAQRGQRADTERVPDGLMGYEHVARSAVGCALASGLMGQGESALRWVGLVEGGEDANTAVREKLGVYRVLAMAYAGAWTQVGTAVQAERGDGTMDALVARLVGVLSFEATAGRATERVVIEHLGRVALGDLVAMNETGHVLDLVSKYPGAVDNGAGFMATFMRALREYNAAQQAHLAGGGDPDEPTTDSGARAGFLRASTGFIDAYKAEDAGEYGAALGSVAVLRGLALYYGSDNPVGFREGAVWFKRAWTALQESDAARAREALWMAVKCSGMGAGLGGTVALARERDDLVREFVRAYPDDPRTALVVYERAAASGREPERAVAELLSIERGSPVYDVARREASGLLYDLYKDSLPGRRAWAARRYAEIAEPLLYLDARHASEGDASAVRYAVLRARRIAEVMLGSPEADSARAADALDVLRGLIARGVVDGGLYDQELLYRRAQIALVEGDHGEAERLVAQLSDEGGGSASSGDRLMYQEAVRRFYDATDDAAVESAADRVVRHGRRVIASLLDEGTAPVDGVLMSVQSDVANASAALWRIRKEQEYLELSRRLVSVLLNAQPYDAGLLRLAGLLAEDAGEDEEALLRWRVLVAGLRRGSDEWFEARVRQLGVLERVDRGKALETIEQHALLYPSYGPDPWGEALRALHIRLSGRGASGGR